MQVLLEAQQKLKQVVQTNVQQAIETQEHDSVVRFVKLYAPLRMQVTPNCPIEMLWPPLHSLLLLPATSSGLHATH